MLTKSTKLKYKLQETNSDIIRALFLENENLPDESLQHFNRTWANLSSLFLGSNQLTSLAGFELCVFPQLTELCLKGNHIQSVEALARVALPNLKKLVLKNNRLCSVRSLRKLNVPNIEHISLEKNSIRDFPGFFEMESPHLTVLELEFSNNKVLSQDIRWLFKLGGETDPEVAPESGERKEKVSRMNELFCKSYQRINNHNIVKQLQLKFVHSLESINL